MKVPQNLLTRVTIGVRLNWNQESRHVGGDNPLRLETGIALWRPGHGPFPDSRSGGQMPSRT